jgi:hypothetical protein
MALTRSDKERKDNLLANGFAECPGCDQTLPVDSFSTNKGRRNGLNSYCKECQRDSYVKSTYNISAGQYRELIQLQENKCAICKSSNGDKRLCVDHCHDTGEVRGLLCHTCNRSIGLLNDDVDLLTNAINYLKKDQ